MPYRHDYIALARWQNAPFQPDRRRAFGTTAHWNYASAGARRRGGPNGDGAVRRTVPTGNPGKLDLSGVGCVLLDEAAAAFEHHIGHALPQVEYDASNPFTGLRDHSLAWAVRHLRDRISDPSWSCMGDAPTSNAVAHVTGFLHFVAVWSHHPLFPVMAATAEDRGCSLHGLALFAAAHALTMMGNRIGFQEPGGYPGRISGFDLATGATEVVSVHLDVFDRFEFPFGPLWDHDSLRTAASETIAGAQGRINLRNPGLLLLSPGTALLGYDEALIEAVKIVMRSVGRKNRGLMAVAPIVLRLQPQPDPQTVRFGYGLFPIINRHFSGESPLQISETALSDRSFAKS